MNKKQTKKGVSLDGQSIIEYLILVGVILALLIVFVGPGGYFQEAFNRTVQKQGGDMLNGAIMIFN